MTRKIIALLLALTMVFALCACGTEQAAPAPATDEKQPPATSEAPAEAPGRTEPLVIRWGATGNGDWQNDNQYRTNKEIMERIEAETDGMITFEYYPGSQLGDATSMFDQVLMGTLDVVTAQPNVAALVFPEFNVLVFPFAYPDMQTFFDSLKSDELYDYFRSITGEKAVYMGPSSASYRGMQNTVRPIRQASDLKGLKVRVQSGQIYTDIFEALGASTASISITELYSALQQGVVNAEENPPMFALSNGFHECAKYTTELNCVNSNAHNFMSAACWNKLSDAEKEIVTAAFREEAEAAQLLAAQELDRVYEEFKAAGVEVIRNSELTAEERASFVEAELPIWEKYSANIDQGFYTLWKSELKTAWEANGYTWTID